MICPICNKGKALPNEKQPQPGTHAYTIVYDCGTKIDYAYGYDDYEEVTVKCTDKKTNSNEKPKPQEKNNKLSSIIFEHKGLFPESDIHLVHKVLGFMVEAIEDAPKNKRDIQSLNGSELMKEVMKKGKGSLNPNTVEKIIKFIKEI